MSEIRILLADDHALVREGLKSVIGALNFSVQIFEAENGKQVLALSQRHDIDMFILDYKMPEMDGFDAAKLLLRINPSCKIMVISEYTDPVVILNLMKLGVKGFLAKNTDIDEFDLAIKTVLQGRVYLSKTIEEPIKYELDLDKRIFPLKFTTRETDVINLLSKGKTSKDISESLGLSFRTIETYRYRLLEKVGVRNTPELLHYLNRIGLASYQA